MNDLNNGSNDFSLSAAERLRRKVKEKRSNIERAIVETEKVQEAKRIAKLKEQELLLERARLRADTTSEVVPEIFEQSSSSESEPVDKPVMDEIDELLNKYSNIPDDTSNIKSIISDEPQDVNPVSEQLHKVVSDMDLEGAKMVSVESSNSDPHVERPNVKPVDESPKVDPGVERPDLDPVFEKPKVDPNIERPVVTPLSDTGHLGIRRKMSANHVANKQPVDNEPEDLSFTVELNPIKDTVDDISDSGVIPTIAMNKPDDDISKSKWFHKKAKKVKTTDEAISEVDAKLDALVSDDNSNNNSKFKLPRKDIFKSKSGIWLLFISAIVILLAGAIASVAYVHYHNSSNSKVTTTKADTVASDTITSIADVEKKLTADANATNQPFKVAVTDLGGGYVSGIVTYYPDSSTKMYMDYSITAPTKPDKVIGDAKSKDIEKKLASKLPVINETITVADKTKVTMATYKQDNGSYNTILLYDNVPFAYVVTDADGNMVNNVTTYYVQAVQAK